VDVPGGERTCQFRAFCLVVQPGGAEPYKQPFVWAAFRKSSTPIFAIEIRITDDEPICACRL